MEDPGIFGLEFFQTRVLLHFLELKLPILLNFHFFLIEELFYQWVQNSLESLTKMQLRLRFATFVLKMQEKPIQILK